MFDPATLRDHEPRARVNANGDASVGLIVSLSWSCSCGTYRASSPAEYRVHLVDVIQTAEANAATADTLPED